MDCLDLKDKRILCELDNNSRQSISEIAKKVRLNKNTTNFRINRMINEKYINGFYTVIDISKLGYNSIRVYFDFNGTNQEKEQEIINYLKREPLISVIGELEMGHSMMISVIVKYLSDFEEFWNKFKIKFRKFFYNEKINFFTKVILLKREYLSLDNTNIEKNEEIIGGSKKEDYDEKDSKILSLLAKNSRISSLDISSKLNIPARTVIDRIKKLEKKHIIVGYRTNLNLDKLGREYYKINLNLYSLNELNKLTEYCKDYSGTIFIDYTLSDYDFEFDVEVKNKKELDEFINKLKNNFPIKSFSILSFRKYHKLESFI